MRFLLKATLDTERASATIKDGSLGRRMESIMAALKPEAAYFAAIDGQRTPLLIIDIQDVSEIPSIAERFWLNFGGKVDLYPVMTGEDLAKGLGSLEGVVKESA